MTHCTGQRELLAPVARRRIDVSYDGGMVTGGLYRFDGRSAQAPGDHLRGNSDNPQLHRHIAEGSARVRFRPVREGWRWVERELYRVFCETFGAPPPGNRMAP